MPRFLLDSTKRASRRGLLGKLENIAVYLILFFLCFAAWRLSVWGWVLYKFHVRLRDNKSLLFLIRLTRVLITLSKIEEKEGNHHVTVYRDYRRRAGGAYRRL